MNDVTKMMKKVTSTHIVSVLAVIVLGYAIYQYSENKNSQTDGMTNQLNGSPVSTSPLSGPDRIKNFPNPPKGKDCNYNVPVQGSGPSGATENLGTEPEYASAKGMGTSQHNLPTSCQKSQVVDPKELMPKGDNEWSKLNPMGQGDLMGVSLLSAQSLEGIQTKGTSLRNANQQFRPDPVIPKTNTGPWHQSTITYDNRPGYEMTCQ